MNNCWNYHNPVSLRFGAGCLREQGKSLPAGKVLLVTTAGMVRRGAVDKLRADLGGSVDWHVVDSVQPNPEVDQLEDLRRQLSAELFTAIIGFGGGSAVDTAKVLSMLLKAPNEFDLRWHLEGKQPVPDLDSLPVYAIPTTSGTGAEVTPFATVWASHEAKKFSYASPRIFPRAAWLDPDYTMSLPKEVTISTGLDAFSQALESIWNRNANPNTLMLAMRAAKLSFTALPKLENWPPSPEVRAQLMEASLLAGLAISQTRTALAHSMSYPVTAHYGLPHGLACSFMLPALLRFNAEADDGRLAGLSSQLGCGESGALASAIEELFERLRIEELLRKYVPEQADLTQLVPEMFTPGRSDNNIRSVERSDVARILDASAI